MGLLKRIALLLAFVCPVSADQIQSTQFRGLNNNESSAIIGPEYAQDLLNVDVTAGGKSIKKRSGYGLYKALGTGQPVAGLFHSYNTNGDDVTIVGSSTSLYGITADGAPVQLVSSATLNSTWDCADSQGNFYCVNSNRDAYIRTDGSTMTWHTSPLGTMVESTPDRIVVAGVAGALNTLYVSQSNTFTNFVTGVNATDAFTEVIASPGSRLTNIRWGCGKLLWWKDQSFGYFDFDDQYTAQVKTVSNTIGTIDNTSAVDPAGRVWFRGQEGHTWMYDCSMLTKQSVDISPFATSAGRRIANFWAQTDSSDFNAGSGVWIDTTTTAGQITLSGKSDDFSNLSGWTQSGTWAVANNIATPSVTSPAYRTLRSIIATIDISTTSKFSGVSVKTNDASDVGVGIMNSSSAAYVARFSDDGGVVAVNFNKTSTLGAPTVLLVSNTIASPVFDATDFHSIDLEIREPTGGLFAYYDGVLVASATDTSITNTNRQVLIALGAMGSVAANFRNPQLVSSTGTFRSAVHNAPDIVTWGSLAINSALNGGTQTFYLRSSTESFTVNSATPAWTSQGSGDTISISTGVYFQFRDDFAITSATQTPTLYDFTLNWIEGLVSDQAVMLHFDNAIWESVAYGSGQFTNNYIFKYDLINDGWTVYNFGAGGLINYNNTLYFGDTSAGNIFSYGNSTSDNGTPINAYWKSKDFSGPDPFLQTQMTNIDTFAVKNQGTSLSADYALDTSTTTTSYSISLSDVAKRIIQSRKLLPSGKLGQVFNVQYGDTSTTSNWELLGYRIGFIQLPYRPSR